MTRYVPVKQVTNLSWWEATPQALPHPQAWLPDPVDTKLLDADGNKIMRLPDQIGFLRK